MANSQERGFGEKLNTWMQTIAIIMAAAWAVYTFIYKEILVPKSAPVNISLDLELKKSATSATRGVAHGKQFDAIEMKVSAKNPSSRTIYLLPNKFIAYGFKITADGSEIPEQIPTLEKNPCGMITKNYTLSKPSVIVIGDIIYDFLLRPGEQVGRVLVFLVPKGEYDILEVITRIPTTAKETEDFRLIWKFTKDGELDHCMYRVTPDKKLEELKKKEGGGFINYPDELEWQYAETTSMLSLW
jgi:hypothetical protein